MPVRSVSRPTIANRYAVNPQLGKPYSVPGVIGPTVPGPQVQPAALVGPTQEQVRPGTRVPAFIVRTVATPYGSIGVRFAAQQKGNIVTLTPQAITQNVIFPITAAKPSGFNGGFFEAGTQNYTYAVTGGKVMAEPANGSLGVFYQGPNRAQRYQQAKAQFQNANQQVSYYQNLIAQYQAGKMTGQQLGSQINGTVGNFTGNLLNYYQGAAGTAKEAMQANAPVEVATASGKALTALPNAAYTQQAYSGGQLIGTFAYKPVVANGAVSLEYTGFGGTSFYATTKGTFTNPTTGQTYAVGFTYPVTTSFNPATGMISFNGQNVHWTTANITGLLPPANLFLNPQSAAAGQVYGSGLSAGVAGKGVLYNIAVSPTGASLNVLGFNSNGKPSSTATVSYASGLAETYFINPITKSLSFTGASQPINAAQGIYLTYSAAGTPSLSKTFFSDIENGVRKSYYYGLAYGQVFETVVSQGVLAGQGSTGQAQPGVLSLPSTNSNTNTLRLDMTQSSANSQTLQKGGLLSFLTSNQNNVSAFSSNNFSLFSNFNKISIYNNPLHPATASTQTAYDVATYGYPVFGPGNKVWAVALAGTAAIETGGLGWAALATGLGISLSAIAIVSAISATGSALTTEILSYAQTGKFATAHNVVESATIGGIAGIVLAPLGAVLSGGIAGAPLFAKTAIYTVFGGASGIDFVALYGKATGQQLTRGQLYTYGLLGAATGFGLGATENVPGNAYGSYVLKTSSTAGEVTNIGATDEGSKVLLTTTGKLGEPVDLYVGKVNGLSLRIVGDVTENPASGASLANEYVGTESTNIHATASEDMRSALQTSGARIRLIGAEASDTSPWRAALDLRNFYKAPQSVNGEPTAYGGYIGIGGGESEGVKFVSGRPALVVFNKEIVSDFAPYAGESDSVYIARINMRSGETGIAQQNYLGISTERQVITPAKFAGRFGNYEGSDIVSEGKIGTAVVRDNPTLSRIVNVLGTRTSVVDVFGAKTVPAAVEGNAPMAASLDLGEYNAEQAASAGKQVISPAKLASSPLLTFDPLASSQAKPLTYQVSRGSASYSSRATSIFGSVSSSLSRASSASGISSIASRASSALSRFSSSPSRSSIISGSRSHSRPSFSGRPSSTPSRPSSPPSSPPSRPSSPPSSPPSRPGTSTPRVGMPVLTVFPRPVEQKRESGARTVFGYVADLTHAVLGITGSRTRIGISRPLPTGRRGRR